MSCINLVLKNLSLEVSGSGVVRPNNLKCEKPEIEISGSGMTHIFGAPKMDLVISGNGTVKLTARPESLKLRKSGHGRFVFPD